MSESDGTGVVVQEQRGGNAVGRVLRRSLDDVAVLDRDEGEDDLPIGDDDTPIEDDTGRDQEEPPEQNATREEELTDLVGTVTARCFQLEQRSEKAEQEARKVVESYRTRLGLLQDRLEMVDFGKAQEVTLFENDVLELQTDIEVEMLNFEVEDEDGEELPPQLPPILPPPLLLQPVEEEQDKPEKLDVEIPGDPFDKSEMEALLKDSQQALHRMAGSYGGLEFCVKHQSEFPKDQQKPIRILGDREARRKELLAELKKTDLTKEQIGKLSNQVRGFHDIVGKEITGLTKGKQERGAEAIKSCDFGEDEAEAIKAIQQLVVEWRTIKITDAPNTNYFPKPQEPTKKDYTKGDVFYEDAYNKAVDEYPEKLEEYIDHLKQYTDKYPKQTKTSLSEMNEETVHDKFHPSNRYVHVDGDQYVNGAKSAAAKVARALVPEVNLEDEKKIILEQEGKERKDTILKDEKLMKKIETKALEDFQSQWYKTEGAKMLNEAGEPGVAKSWQGGDFLPDEPDIETMMKNPANINKVTGKLKNFDELDPEQIVFKPRDKDISGTMEAIGQKFQSAFEEFKKTTLAQQVNSAVDKLVDKGVEDKAAARKGKKMEDETMKQGDYWCEVGRLAKKSDYGRCFSCAGVAASSLVMNPAFDKKTIESVGATTYDHHFLLVGRTGDAGSTKPPELDSTVLVVDVWQANQGGDPPATAWKDFQYNDETKLKVFSIMPAGKERQELRQRCLEYAKQQDD